MDRHDTTLFGKSGAYAQAFALFNCAIAGGVVVGPLWTSLATDPLGWGNMNLCLAVFALSGTMVVVSHVIPSRPFALLVSSIGFGVSESYVKT